VETSGDPAAPAQRFMTSGAAEPFAALGARFLGPEVGAVEAWQWS
jgi:hypothetical protein